MNLASLMENILGDLHLNWCIIYVDDIIVYSKTPEEHIECLRGVFEKLSKAGLKLEPSKCKFFKEKITYLGHIVSKDRIETEPKKMAAMKHWPRPKTVTQVQKCLGFTNYYCKFLFRYAQIARPLNMLISVDSTKMKHTKIVWDDECEEALWKLKDLCSNTPCLVYPDYKQNFKLYTDTSKSGLGAVLA